jgi:hypothetical protein
MTKMRTRAPVSTSARPLTHLSKNRRWACVIAAALTDPASPNERSGKTPRSAPSPCPHWPMTSRWPSLAATLPPARRIVVYERTTSRANTSYQPVMLNAGTVTAELRSSADRGFQYAS